MFLIVRRGRDAERAARASEDVVFLQLTQQHDEAQLAEASSTHAVHDARDSEASEDVAFLQPTQGFVFSSFSHKNHSCIAFSRTCSTALVTRVLLAAAL